MMSEVVLEGECLQLVSKPRGSHAVHIVRRRRTQDMDCKPIIFESAGGAYLGMHHTRSFRVPTAAFPDGEGLTAFGATASNRLQGSVRCLSHTPAPPNPGYKAHLLIGLTMDQCRMQSM